MGEAQEFDRVAELRELEKAATPGPWIWATDEGAPVYVQLYCADEGVTEYEADVLSSDERGVLVGESNAALIAAMRNALPALLDVAEAARDAVRGHPVQRTCVCSACRTVRALARLDGGDGHRHALNREPPPTAHRRTRRD